jgi:hypothetical protein
MDKLLITEDTKHASCPRLHMVCEKYPEEYFPISITESNPKAIKVDGNHFVRIVITHSIL